MTGELSGGDTLPVRARSRREGGDDLLLAELLDSDLGRGVLGEQAEGGIDSVLGEVGEHVAGGPLLQLDLDPGVGLAEADQYPWDVDLPGRQRCPDPDLATHQTPKLVHLMAQAIDLIEDAPRTRGHGLSRLGDRH